MRFQEEVKISQKGLRIGDDGIAEKNDAGLAFNSIVNDSRLLKAHVQTSKICLLLPLNILQIGKH